MEIIVRQEEEKDYEAVYQTVKEAFEKAVFSNHDEHDLVIRLRSSGAFVPELSLVAEIDGNIIGYVLFTKALIRKGIEEHLTLILAPIAVLPEFQRQGIGRRLIEAGHEAARKLGFTSSLLVGHPSYYPRFGYKPAENLGITTKLDLPPDVFMVCEIIPSGLNGVKGELIFAPEFNL